MSQSKTEVGVFGILVKDLSWYHPDCTRHIAESLLMQNGQEGSYLIRPSSLPGEMAVSVRSKDSVKHFNVVWNGQQFVFGLATFSNREEFLGHFQKQPFIAGDSGITTQLKHPYPRLVSEPSTYEVIRLHGQYGQTSVTMPATLAINSKSGFLTKLGGFVKNWKLRWFVLQRNHLSYFRSQFDKEPIRKMDLAECRRCSKNETFGKDFCFSLEFSWRTFHLISDSQGDFEEWMAIIEWKIKNNKKSLTLKNSGVS